MDHAPQPAPASTKRTKRKADPAYLAHQHAQGMTTRELGKEYGVAHTTIINWLDKVEQEKRGVERFKHNRADILARIQGKTLVLQEQLVDELLEDRLANPLTPQQKSSLLQSLNIVHGTLFDKERLERGQSSHNISVLSRMIDNTVDDIYKPVTQPVVVEQVSTRDDSVSVQEVTDNSSG